ncbi:MAG: hypothetical protein PHP46_01755 [Candidatus Omnitrophica bacterium]|nr:hypothetical protein [Candidatus Omnitrophota bacterium]
MRAYNFKKIISGVVIFLLICTSCLEPAGGITGIGLEYPLFQKGVCYVTWSKETFATPTSDQSIKNMAEANIGSVAIVVTWYQDEYNSFQIKATDRSPSDASIRHAIRKAHKLGISVMLKPHVDLIHQDGVTRSDIGFQADDEWQKWFKAYENFIVHYARMAEEEKVEFFCIGTELAFTATRKDLWKGRIIPAVRKRFSGQLTYAANWDEYRDVGFWDDLDYVGIDAYFPLADKPDPTYEEIKAGWQKWYKEIEAWQAGIGKPILFTECGYASADHAAMKPWDEPMGGKPNLRVQADCYRALFETFWGKPWFYGIYWWNWNTYPGSGGENNRSFTPQNKPALNYVKMWYSRTPTMIAALDKTDRELNARLELESEMMSRKAKDGSRNISSTGEMAGQKRTFGREGYR